jgi:TPR repeat protein
MKNFLGLIFFVINLYASSQESVGFRGLHSRSLPDITNPHNFKDRGVQMLNLGLDCARRGDKDYAMKWLLEAAQCGESKAMNMLGLDCMKEAHYDTAEMWFLRGADLGNMLAKYNLASLYQTKGGMEKENGKVEEGDEYLEIAIKLYREIVPHYPRAKNNLAVILYEQGDEQEALQLWQEAKAGGCSFAIFNVAWAADKRGDIETAKIGYKQSADKGDSDGMFYLAMLYENEEDLLNAKFWYKKAAEKGNKEAESKVKELGSGNLLRRKLKRKLSFYKSP